MNFQDRLNADRFLTVVQLEPPKGVDVGGFLKNADLVRGRADAVLVPELSGGIMRMGSLGGSVLVKRKGTEVIASLNCRDRNRLALQADLLSMNVLDLHNVYIHHGDAIRSGDHIDAVPVDDVNVCGLLEAVKSLQRGVDLAGNELAGAARFCAGAEVNAGLQGPARQVEIREMERKIRAGADFFFTPALYDVQAFESFLKEVEDFHVPVFPRVMILNSVGMARFMCRHMEGVLIPEELLDRLAKAADKQKEAIAIAAETIVQYQGVCRGVLLVAVGQEERLAGVLEKTGL